MVFIQGYAVDLLFQNPTGRGPGQPAVVDPTWAGALHQVISRGPFWPQLFCDLQL